MNFAAISHISGTLDICPRDDGTLQVRIRTGRHDFCQVCLLYTCNKFNWWQGQERLVMTLAFTDSDFDYYHAVLPLTDTRFAYIFELTQPDGRVLYYSEEGLTSSYDHTFAYFTYFQYTSLFDCDRMSVPSWVPGVCAYQIFPERFAIGDTTKDRRYINAAWGALPEPKSFYGGDLEGIRQHLPYLRELGVTLLYLTPVFCSISNHKYDIYDYENVDPAFGGNEALRRLIADAHAHGIRIMLDGVFNHCSNRHPFFKDVKKNGRLSPYYDWFFIDGDRPDEAKGNYRMFGQVDYMPKLNTGHPEVIRYFSGVAARWMREYGVDAWRLDVSDELSHRFLRAFRDQVTAVCPEALIIGEDWHACARCLNGDEYDGVMNYALTKACLDLLVFGTISPAVFRDRLVRLYHRQSSAAAEKMLNLLDSHDTDRFLTRVRADARRYRAAAAMLFFYPGIPCVYYGDEIGLEGGYDPDCRRCFDWNADHWDTETQTLIRRLMQLKKEPALAHGQFGLTEHDGVLTFTRQAPGSCAVLTVNGTDTERAGLPPYGYTIQYNKEDATL